MRDNDKIEEENMQKILTTFIVGLFYPRISKANEVVVICFEGCKARKSLYFLNWRSLDFKKGIMTY